MRLLADLNISPRVVEHLRAIGHDVERVGQTLDARATDEQILSDASRRSAIVVTRDQDFSALIVTRGAVAPSLLNLRVSEVDAEAVARLIASVLRAVEQDLAAGAIVTVDDGGMRVRRLPVA